MNCSVCNHENPEGARFCSGCGALLADSGASGAGLVGRVLDGRYKVLRVLGEGGMGVVYEAEQRMGEGTRSVAIKTLLPELSTDHTLVSRFHRESGTVAQLEHPNTIRFYDYGETPDGELYIVMELVKGQALTDLIEQGPVPLPRALHILRQVCGALHEAHTLGIVHRDLKPDNIVLTSRAGEEDFVKLLDFGIAAHVGPDATAQTKLTQQGMVLGTPPYMSPEQLAGEKLGPASDVYSLGVIAYEMLTGQLPFEADTPWLWAHKHMTEPPRPMESFEAGQKLAEAVRRAVMHALEKTPIQRPSTTLELYRELAGGKTTEDMMPDAGHTEPGNDGPRTSPMPAVPPMTTPGGPAASPAFHTASALAAPVRAQPPVRRKRRGWIALAGLLVAGGALAAGVVAFERARSVGPAPEGAGGTLSVAGSSTTQIAPLVDAAPATVSVPAPEPPVVKTSAPAPARTPAQPAKKPEKPEPPVASSPAPQLPPISLPAPQPSATASKPPRFPQITLPQLNLPTRPAPQPKPAPPKPTGPTGNAACAQASSLASGGNIEGAVAMYNRCRSTGGSANAQRTAAARIRTRAPVVVKQRAYLGNCAGARSAASAASSIGVGAPAQAALAGTKC